MNTIRTILHPTDLSNFSQVALDKAIELARDHNARLVLLHVQAPPETVEGEFGMIPPEPLPEDQVILNDLQRLLPLEELPFPVEFRVAHGEIVDEINRAARQTDANLIVLATHGHRSFLTRWLHDNIAETVVESAPCEVMTVESVPMEEPAFLE